MVNAKVAPAPTAQSKTKKRVSFADPVASVLREPPEVACENIKSPIILQDSIILSTSCCLPTVDPMLDEFMLCASHAAAQEKYMRPNSIRGDQEGTGAEHGSSKEPGGYGQQVARTAPDCKSRQIPYSPASLISVN